MSGITIISDFDGTISKGEFPLILLDKFCKLDWRELDHQYRQGKMTLHELIETEVKNLDIDREGLAEFARKTIKFRDGFWEFYQSVQAKGFDLVIASEGLKEYILPFFSEEAVRIIANECSEEEDGTLHLITPHSSEVCLDCGTCKKEIVLSYRDKGHFIVYIGDGESDYCAAEFADIRFARSLLAKHLELQHFEFILFEDFLDILEIVDKM